MDFKFKSEFEMDRLWESLRWKAKELSACRSAKLERARHGRNSESLVQLQGAQYLDSKFLRVPTKNLISTIQWYFYFTMTMAYLLQLLVCNATSLNIAIRYFTTDNGWQTWNLGRSQFLKLPTIKEKVNCCPNSPGLPNKASKQ